MSQSRNQEGKASIASRDVVSSQPELAQVLDGMSHFEHAVKSTCNSGGTARLRLMVNVREGLITQVKTDDETEHLPAKDQKSSSRQSS